MKYLLLSFLLLTACSSTQSTKVADQPTVIFYDNIRPLPCTTVNLSGTCNTLVASR